VAGILFLGALAYALWHGLYAVASTTVSFGLSQFSAAFLNEYWLQFELTSVLLVAAIVAALAVIKGSGKSHG
jgi:NADH-quinone oxidoreductase subunit J